MKERQSDNYFIVIRLVLMLVVSACSLLERFGLGDNISINTGVSVEILLLVSFYLGFMSVKELFEGKLKIILVLISVLIVAALYIIGGKCFILMIYYSIFEVLSLFPGIDYRCYFIPLITAFIDSPLGVVNQILVVTMLAIIYVQHNYVVTPYQKRMIEDTVLEQGLKRDIRETEYAAKAELRRNMLKTENQILEERASLSQTLHDKLGHSINGSIYQLEGVKVLMDKDPEKSKSMIQAVIDQLRTGMDEIRAILRKERPEKKELAMLQLYKLCEDCNDKGVETKLEVEGDTSLIPEPLWEVILDNSFEAVSNSMKYSKCSHIFIEIVVMNKMVRCSIRDDGKGAATFEDGMGISGMRRRVREASGNLDFETEVGFTVNMLLPLE